MRYETAINIDELRRAAKRRLPKIAFDFIEGGVEDERGLDRNEEAFRRIGLVPRYLVDVSRRDQSTTLFGRAYSSPFGIAPTGLAGLFRPGADMMLAQAARDANVPFIMSGTGTGSIEDLGRIAPDHGWYQLYMAKTKSISEDMVARAEKAGLQTLVITVDVPQSSKRERNLRNGFSRPLKMRRSIMLEALTHPGWMMEYFRTGTPLFSNWQQYAPAGSDADGVANFVSTQTNAPLTWADIERFRTLWPRKLVLKGVMRTDDALRAADMGVDGLMVSNHGARQLDRAPSPIEVLPAINAAVGDRMTLMLDSGIRRGVDVATALCLGAKFVFMGRATLYGAAAGGVAGATMALGIIRGELDLAMAQMGCPDLSHLGPDMVFQEEPGRNRL